MRVRLRLTPDLAANVLGVAGLVCVVVAIGGLTGTWWWSLAATGLTLVGLSYSAHTRVTGQPLTPVSGESEVGAA